MIFHPDALAEFEAAIAYHEEAREGYGERLRAAVLAEVDRAERFPDIGHEVEGFAKRHDVRRLVVELFPYCSKVTTDSAPNPNAGLAVYIGGPRDTDRRKSDDRAIT